MIIFNDIDSIDVKESTSIAIGTFDGVHLGHLTVLKNMQKTADEKGIKSLIYTFSNNPLDVIFPDNPPKKIMDVDEKISTLKMLSPDYLAIVKFGKLQLSLYPEEFVTEVLIKKMKAAHITVGHDFRFGKEALGDANSLLEYGNKYGFGVTIIPPVTWNGERVSSTTIRGLLSRGDVKTASTLLSRNHFIRGEIIYGKQRGSSIFKIPTINMLVKEPSYTMRKGVYFTKVNIKGQKYNGITNIGYNPTFTNDMPQLHMETYIYDFDENVYGEIAELEFIDFYRDEIRFSNTDDLKKQMELDLKRGIEFFSSL